jgi:hypothetical protein
MERCIASRRYVHSEKSWRFGILKRNITDAFELTTKIYLRSGLYGTRRLIHFATLRGLNCLLILDMRLYSMRCHDSISPFIRGHELYRKL